MQQEADKCLNIEDLDLFVSVYTPALILSLALYCGFMLSCGYNVLEQPKVWNIKK